MMHVFRSYFFLKRTSIFFRIPKLYFKKFSIIKKKIPSFLRRFVVGEDTIISPVLHQILVLIFWCKKYRFWRNNFLTTEHNFETVLNFYFKF